MQKSIEIKRGNNSFYLLTCNNLAINRYFADVESKLNTLKETLEQLHDEKMERIKNDEKANNRFQYNFEMGCDIGPRINFVFRPQ